MHSILASYSTSITELKRNPKLILEEAQGAPIAVLNHNKPMAYLVPAETFEILLEAFEDKQLIDIAVARESEHQDAIEVDLDEL